MVYGASIYHLKHLHNEVGTAITKCSSVFGDERPARCANEFSAYGVIAVPQVLASVADVLLQNPPAGPGPEEYILQVINIPPESFSL